MAFGNPGFNVFELPEEHVALREAIRALAEKEIEPHAADVDENARFPQEALDALVASGFNAIHVPEEYDGQGADSVAACIVIEEVARVCASSSLIPAVNKLGTMGLILNGSDELKAKVLPSIAAGEAMASYALSEREAGSDAASMKTRARKDGSNWVLNGSKCWITNGGKSSWYTVMAVTDPRRRPTASRRSWSTRTTRASPSARWRRSSASRDHPLPNCISRTAPFPRIGSSVTRHRLQDRAADPRPHPPDHRCAGRRHRAGCARQGHRLCQGPQAVRQADQLVPGCGVHDRRHGDEGRGRPADGLHLRRSRRAWREEPRLHQLGVEVLCLRRRHGGHHRRVQLFGGAGYTRDFPVERMMRDARSPRSTRAPTRFSAS